MKNLYESVFSVAGKTPSELNNSIKNVAITSIIDVLNENPYNIVVNNNTITFDKNIIDIPDHETLAITPPTVTLMGGITIGIGDSVNDILSSYNIKKLRINPPSDKKNPSSVEGAYARIMSSTHSNHDVIGNLQECNFTAWSGFVPAAVNGFNGTTFIADHMIGFCTYYSDNNVKFECEYLTLHNYLKNTELKKCRQGCFSGNVKKLFYAPPLIQTVNDTKKYLDLIMGTKLDKKLLDQYLTANASSAAGVSGWIDEYNLNADDIRKRLGIENIQAQQIYIVLVFCVRSTWPKMIIFNIVGDNITIDTLNKAQAQRWQRSNYNYML